VVGAAGSEVQEMPVEQPAIHHEGIADRACPDPNGIADTEHLLDETGAAQSPPEPTSRSTIHR
jgi:hypothetical protein